MVEQHPLSPFLPKHTRLWMLGSFPPPQIRWSIDFYYPNFTNDMWRIMGLIFYGNKDHFVDKTHKKFHKKEIIEFLEEKGIALYDTATEVNRLKDNASDKFLEVVTPTPICDMLQELPECTSLVTTGQKATDTLCELFKIEAPALGKHQIFYLEEREMKLFRMPSSSRAYPLPVEQKAIYYRQMFEEAGIDFM